MPLGLVRSRILSSRLPVYHIIRDSRRIAMASTSTSTPPPPPPADTPYESWTKEQLIARLTALEAHAHPLPPSSSTPAPPPARPKSPKPFDFSAHPRIKIALKFCYTGAAYNGLAFQQTPTPLPTVEGALFAALAHARLVDAAAGLEGCGWERCGRTDRGVSGAGQVVSLWVRAAHAGEGEDEPRALRYLPVLNRLLPATLRILAWARVAPAFSARFDCRARHYKYFFRARALDVGAMRAAAALLVGEHDFRNLCKLDPSKQITNFHRRVLRADIAPVAADAAVPDAGGALHVLDLVGTAFLYHQVRHIMAVLLLVGAGLERADVVSALLNTAPGKEPGARAVVACKPEYQMADALPLVLWDCWYRAEDVRWRVDSDGDAGAREEKGGAGALGVRAQLDAQYERALIGCALDAHFVAAAAAYHGADADALRDGKGMLSVPLGGGTVQRVSRHVPLLERKRLDPVEAANARYMQGKGGRREERRRREPAEDGAE